MAGGGEDALLLHINHQGVDGALVAAGVKTHSANQVGAGHRTIVDQVSADGSADDGGEHRSVAVESIVADRGQGSAPLSVVSDDHPVAADLSVSILLTEVQAEQPGAVGVGGSVLPRSGGADHVVAGHRSLSELRSV